MKKLLASLLITCMIGLNTAPLFAADASAIKDIPEDFWAKPSINCVITNDIMSIDEDGNFNPEGTITRIEFIQALLKILSNDNLDTNISNKFTDVSEEDAIFQDILRSEQLGLIYGYPDNTFQANNAMLRSETTSVISHITKDKFVDCSILDIYTDKNEIAEWAKIPYAKSISYGIFVNYPDENKLEPNRTLTRAEAAVLLARLKDKLTIVKPEYKKPKEITLAREHLAQIKKAPEDLVRVTNLRKVVYQGNVLTPVYESRFESKKQTAGDEVIFVFNEDVRTVEGSLVIPAQSKIISEVEFVRNPEKWNRNAKVCMNYKQLVFPDGATYDLTAKTYSKDAMLQETWWQTSLKAISVVGLFTPGLNYRTKCGEKVKIELVEILGIKDPQIQPEAEQEQVQIQTPEQTQPQEEIQTGDQVQEEVQENIETEQNTQEETETEQ